MFLARLSYAMQVASEKMGYRRRFLQWRAYSRVGMGGTPSEIDDYPLRLFGFGGGSAMSRFTDALPAGVLAWLKFV